MAATASEQCCGQRDYLGNTDLIQEASQCYYTKLQIHAQSFARCYIICELYTNASMLLNLKFDTANSC